MSARYFIHTYHVGAADILVHNTDGLDACKVRPFGTGKPPHKADVTITKADGTSVTKPYESGNMTPDEAALAFPQSTFATHTEARAVKDDPLLEGDSMVIEGQYPPCPSCKESMNAGVRDGGSIEYRWPGGVWIAGRR